MTQAQRTLNNRYELVAKIGDGGMAVVFKALDRKLNRTVAVKVLRESYASDPQFLARFTREAQSAASLTHPNIVSVYDVGQDGDVHYIVMEYIEGQNLKEVITEYAPLPTQLAIEYAIQMCNALGYAHSKGLIHRDVKPQNMLIDRGGQIKVADFGIAKGLGDVTLTQAGFTLGTVHYFSPEQAQGKPALPQSDLYSIGVVLYEMLTGRIPFESDNPLALALKHIEEAPTSPRKYNPAIPPALEQLILKALAKQPAQRYPNAAAFAQALKDFENSTEKGTLAVPKVPNPVVVENDPYAPNNRQQQRLNNYQPGYEQDNGDDIYGVYNNNNNVRRRQTPVPTNYQDGNSYYDPNSRQQPYYQGQGGRNGAGNVYQQSRANIPPVVQDYEEEIPGSRGSGCVPWLVGTLLFGMLAGLVVVLFIFVVPALTKPQPTATPALPTATLGPAVKVDVPDLKNKTLAEAEDSLKQAGLVLGKTDTKTDDKVEGGRVISQSIVAGKGKADKGSKVDLTISQGIDAVELPQRFVNTPFDQTKQAIENLGFKTQRIDQPSDTIGTGAVIRTDPEGGPGQKIPRSVVIKIFVSTGPLPTATPQPTVTPTLAPQPTNTPVPKPTPVLVAVPAKLIGTKQADATKTLQNAGFVVEILPLNLDDIKRRFPGDQGAIDTWSNLKEGEVLGTDPKEGTQLEKGSKVVLAVKKLN